MKKCPYCAEEIQDEAIVCKHCGKDINVEKTKPKKIMELAIDDPTTTVKKPGVFVPAFKVGLALAAFFTFFDALKIWKETPSVAHLASLGATGKSALTAYRLSMLIGAAIPNLVLWFVVALIVMFVLQQIKKT